MTGTDQGAMDNPSKRRKTDHADTGQDGEDNAKQNAACRETLSQLFDQPAKASCVLGFCDFSTLLACRSVSKALRDAADGILVERALASLPTSAPLEFSSSLTGNIEIDLGWSKAYSSLEALADTALESVYDDKVVNDKASTILASRGWVDAEDFDEENDSGDNNKDDTDQHGGYTQKAYEKYVKDAAHCDEGWGVGILFEDSISVSHAVKYFREMVSVLEEMGWDEDFLSSDDMKVSKQCAFGLLVAGRASSIRHVYFACQNRHMIDDEGDDHRGAALQFLTAGNRQVEISLAYENWYMG